MRITKARFLKSMKQKGDYPGLDMDEIAVCGKSNVGKSSLINLLTNNSKLAKVSGSPGKTRLCNFFVINEEFLLVDLPGYGYAKVSKAEKDTWPAMMEDYFSVARRLRAFLILVDIRHQPTANDMMMFEWAAHFGLHVIIVATKADKIAKTRRHQRLREIKQKVGGGIDYPVVAVSALKKIGVDALLSEIERHYNMNIYAIGDLHLSGFTPKPMHVFGDHWNDHWTKIQNSWSELVCNDDIVLIPGDLSWAMKLSEAKVDIDAICAMPGSKVMIKGNHDYWWSSLAQVNAMLTNNTVALQNNSVKFGDYVIAGSRGWTCPGTNQYDAETDEKLYLREAGRLELSLQHARKLAPDATLICMMHYPPTDQTGSGTLYTELFEKYGAAHVVYGHLHSGSIQNALSGNVRGVNYTLVSCDATDFKLVKIV